MQSKAADVDAYVAEVPAERLAAIRRLRALCQRNLIGFEETIEYGMPCYRRNGTVEVSFASQKQYIAIYTHRTALIERFREKLAAASIGKSCIRYTRPEAINFAAVSQLLRKVAAAAGSPASERTGPSVTSALRS